MLPASNFKIDAKTKARESEMEERRDSSQTVNNTPCGTVYVRTKDILQGARMAVIEHNGQNYLLRVTANGKLILTK